MRKFRGPSASNSYQKPTTGGSSEENHERKPPQDENGSRPRTGTHLRTKNLSYVLIQRSQTRKLAVISNGNITVTTKTKIMCWWVPHTLSFLQLATSITTYKRDKRNKQTKPTNKQTNKTRKRYMREKTKLKQQKEREGGFYHVLSLLHYVTLVRRIGIILHYIRIILYSTSLNPLRSVGFVHDNFKVLNQKPARTKLTH